MIHAGMFVADTIVVPPPYVSFSDNGNYTGTAVSVTITVHGAPKLRYKIDSGAWTIYNGTSRTISVPLSYTGHTLYADALNSSDVVLASNDNEYFRESSG